MVVHGDDVWLGEALAGASCVHDVSVPDTVLVERGVRDTLSDVDVRACYGKALQNEVVRRSGGVPASDPGDGEAGGNHVLVRTSVYWFKVLYLFAARVPVGGNRTSRGVLYVEPVFCCDEQRCAPRY